MMRKSKICLYKGGAFLASSTLLLSGCCIGEPYSTTQIRMKFTPGYWIIIILFSAKTLQEKILP